MRRILLVAACLATLASPAWPQANAGAGKAGVKDTGQIGIQQQGQLSDSTRVNSGSTGSGNQGAAWVTDPYRDRDTYLDPTLIIGPQWFGRNNLPASGNRSDSSIVLDTHAYGRLFLHVNVLPTALTSVAKLAIQIRSHMTASGDSTFAMPIPWYSQSDSTFQKRAAAASGNDSTAWSTEKEFDFNTWQSSPGEYPPGLTIPLISDDGSWMWARRLSVRIRWLNSLVGTKATVADSNRVRVSCYISGRPQ